MLQFKGISFLTAYLAISVIILFLSHKELQLEKLIKWAELTQESKYFCGIRKNPVKTGEFGSMKRNLQKDNGKSGFLKRKNIASTCAMYMVRIGTAVFRLVTANCDMIGSVLKE